jgi:hypothetical protein
MAAGFEWLEIKSGKSKRSRPGGENQERKNPKAGKSPGVKVIEDEQ